MLYRQSNILAVRFSLLNCRPVAADMQDNTCEEFENVYKT